MADEADKNLPRSAVVVYTDDGRRIKPACPMCHRVYWGKLVPPGVPADATVLPMIPARVGGDMHGMEVQQWVCLNCGYLWHMTGAVSAKAKPKYKAKVGDDDK
jgi:hypothetical protein